MSSRNLRRALPAVVLAAGLCLPLGAAEARTLGGGPPAGERLWSWVQGFVASLWEKTGMTIDPNGGQADGGMHIDPNGQSSPSGDTGMMIDPHG